MALQDKLITDFHDPLFQTAFRTYFAEYGIQLKENSGGLWKEFHDDGSLAYLRIEDGTKCIGFILFETIIMKHWLFEEPCGLIREFWVDPAHRKHGIGSELLSLAEHDFADQGLHRVLLTSDTAEDFYLRNGYQKHSEIHAKNDLDVFIKHLR